MSTPHIEAKESEIAKIVLMPGDPLRAKFIAEKYLTDVFQFNKVRNIFGYTGKYKGKTISVMASGMGIPSIGIYSFELFKNYDVDKIIRVGSCGAYNKDLHVYDTILVTDAYSESTFGEALGYTERIMFPDSKLNEDIKKIATSLNIPLTEGRIHSSDAFYRVDSDHYKFLRDKHNCLAVEMESFGLFANARFLNKKAACILTVSDTFETNEITTPEEREKSFTNMIEIALELVNY